MIRTQHLAGPVMGRRCCRSGPGMSVLLFRPSGDKNPTTCGYDPGLSCRYAWSNRPTPPDITMPATNVGVFKYYETDQQCQGCDTDQELQ
jgi:hypothetical protein